MARAGTAVSHPKIVIAEELGRASSAVRNEVGPEENIKRSMRYHARKTKPAAPQDSTFVLDPRFEANTTGDEFLLADRHYGSDRRVLSFGTAKTLEFLAGCQDWFLDGTFKIAPPGFKQVVIIRGENSSGDIATCCYCLFTHKDQEIYTYMLLDIRLKASTEYGIQMIPQGCTIDFEQALRTALKAVWPTLTDDHIQGCYFHLRQCSVRHIQKKCSKSHMESLLTEQKKGIRAVTSGYVNNRLMSRYRSDNQTHEFLVLLDSLPFFPPNLVLEAYEAIKLLAPQDERMARYLAYKEKVWLGYQKSSLNGLVLTRRFVQPKIPIDWWSCWERTLHGGARTNNACEGFNSMAVKLANKHADVYTLLQAFILPDNVLEEKFIDSIGTARYKARRRITVKQRRKNKILRKLCKRLKRDLRGNRHATAQRLVEHGKNIAVFM